MMWQSQMDDLIDGQAVHSFKRDRARQPDRFDHLHPTLG
jgi:hypothetical protein